MYALLYVCFQLYNHSGTRRIDKWRLMCILEEKVVS